MYKKTGIWQIFGAKYKIKIEKKIKKSFFFFLIENLACVFHFQIMEFDCHKTDYSLKILKIRLCSARIDTKQKKLKSGL